VSERTPTRPESHVLTDPRAIKALAHPARLTVLDALSEGGELTATECAEAAGISPSAMSYHLRALEKWGFVERAEHSEDGRERPWRAVPGGWEIDPLGDRATNAAANAVLATMFGRLQNEFARWADREREQPAEWRALAAVENWAGWLTAEEAEELQKFYREFIDSRRGRTARDHPDGARRVRAVRVLLPLQLD
jgi:DNA-binding transcriptional ArsR family regulator